MTGEEFTSTAAQDGLGNIDFDHHLRSSHSSRRCTVDQRQFSETIDLKTPPFANNSCTGRSFTQLTGQPSFRLRRISQPGRLILHADQGPFVSISVAPS